MKTYPTIPRAIHKGPPCYVFDKLDGSNIRAEYSRKKGSFYKFGTRKRLLDSEEAILGKAQSLFLDKYADDLICVFEKQRWDRAIAFFEFYGKNSFAGNHVENEPQTVTLIDVNYQKKGILNPREFVKLFSHLDTAKLLHCGNINQTLINEVKTGTLKGMTFEGVVCKSVKFVSPGLPLMFKIKNDAWINKLEKQCKGDDKLFRKLM